MVSGGKKILFWGVCFFSFLFWLVFVLFFVWLVICLFLGFVGFFVGRGWWVFSVVICLGGGFACFLVFSCFLFFPSTSVAPSDCI